MRSQVVLCTNGECKWKGKCKCKWEWACGKGSGVDGVDGVDATTCASRIRVGELSLVSGPDMRLRGYVGVQVEYP